MAVLFRPFFPVDKSHWAPVLAETLADMDFRVFPDVGNPEDIRYYITWNLYKGDRIAWPNLKAVLSMRAGSDWYIGHPEAPVNASFVRMIDPGLTCSMREYVAAYVLRLHRELGNIERNFATMGNWNVLVPKLASERSVGFMGIGHLGMACADALKPFGFQLRGWSRSPKNLTGIETFSGDNDLDAFLAGTEILVCLLPLTPGTQDILDRQTLCRLPKGAALVNVARGKHLVENDLVALLDSGHLSHAVLDVFREEPLPDGHPFRTHPKITATPHIAAVTMPHTGSKKLRETIDLLERGGTPEGLLHPDRDY